MTKGPFVSIIMPVRNEAAYLERGLKAVLEQDYPKDRMEIIIADGMSTDGTRKIIVELQKKNLNIQLIDNPGKIVSSGLNAGIEKSTGEIIVRVDGHCEIAPDYVSRCVDYLQSGNADGVGGPIKTIGENFLSKAIAQAMSSRFGVGGSAFRIGVKKPVQVDTIAFAAYKRSTLQKAGPFDEELVRNQDDEYNHRLRKMGYRLLLAPDIRSKYYSRASLQGLGGQYFQYGFWKVRVFQKHPAQMKLRQFVPSIFLLAVCFQPGIVFPLYVFAVFVASMGIAFRKGWQYLAIMPLIFGILHFSYGLGFLIGMLKFWNRWECRHE